MISYKYQKNFDQLEKFEKIYRILCKANWL